MAVEIDVFEDIWRRNEELAAQVNADLNAKSIFTVNVLGSPGAGKTTVLSHIIPLLNAPGFVIEGDVQSDIDTQRLQALGIPARQINTGGACHLDAPQIAGALSHWADLAQESPRFLFIENIGNLICPAEFTIGEHAKLLIVTVTDGSDKPYKYPLAFEKADVIILNKVDLLPYVDFDRDYFTAGVRRLNADAPIFCVCGRNSAQGQGFEEVASWLMKKAAESGNTIQ